MVQRKYPEYVTTDSDLWNSADEAYFYVVKKKAKPLTSTITPIIEHALETGLLREATKTEIDEYLLEQDIERKLIERRFDTGRNYEETKQNYFKWKESNDKKVEIKKPTIKEEIKSVSEGKDLEGNKIVDIEEKKEEIKPISPTQNAINQKPSVSTKSF
jgi:hypothetical protein